MKKFYLFLGAALLGAGAACAAEPTLETVWQKYYTDYAFDSWNVNTIDWSKPGEITAGTGSRIAVGMNGKLYTLNCKTMSIMELTEEGMKDVYALPSLAGETFTYNEMDDAFTEKTNPDYYGVFITRDDAGHFIVGHAFTKNAAAYVWSIYDPTTNKAKKFDIKFKNLTDNNKYSLLRFDNLGRAMGNVLQDGGLVVPPTASTWASISGKTWATSDVQRMKFINFYSDTENNTDVDNVEVEAELSEWVYLASKQGNICQPLYNSVEEFNAAVKEKGGALTAIKDGTYFYSKDASNSTFVDNKYALTMGAYTGNNAVAPFFDDLSATDFAKNYSSFPCFDTFVLQGERYYVASYLGAKPAPEASANNSFAVFDSKGMIVAVQTIDWTTNAGWCSISTEIEDETTANIYLFGEAGKVTIPGVTEVGNYGVAGQYKFTVPEKSTGVNEIAVDNENAAPVYYNLQGVEVANPENGIYVVRRGSKVTKEVIR